MIEIFILIYFCIGLGIDYGMRKELAHIYENESRLKAILMYLIVFTVWPVMILVGIIKDKL